MKQRTGRTYLRSSKSQLHTPRHPKSGNKHKPHRLTQQPPHFHRLWRPIHLACCEERREKMVRSTLHICYHNRPKAKNSFSGPKPKRFLRRNFFVLFKPHFRICARVFCSTRAKLLFPGSDSFWSLSHSMPLLLHPIIRSLCGCSYTL